MSLGMNATRTYSCFRSALDAGGQREWDKAALEGGKGALAAISLATTVVHFTSGLFITTGVDVIQGASALGMAVWKGEYSKAVEEALQTLASAAYIAFLLGGTLEAMAAFALIHAALSLYQARREIAEGRYLEGCAKLVLAAVRLNQAKGYLELIQKRNAYLEIQRIRDVYARLLRGRAASHLIRHPLASLEGRIAAKDVALLDGKGNEVHFGSHFHGNGGELVKGENLIFRTKIVDGEELIELDFKINHAFRGRLEAAVQQLKSIQRNEMEDLLALSGYHAKKISFNTGSFFEGHKAFFKPGKAQEVAIEGLGTIRIGASPDEPNFYGRVVVQLKGNRSLYELHEMLSIVDLDSAIRLSTKDDLERLKMGHLFRTFFPKEATPFERTEEFFTLALNDLKAKMIEKSPGMEEIFAAYFDRMKEEHIFDGRVRYRIEGLADAAREKGARALTAAVMGAYAEKDLFDRVASMLRIGILSTEVRDANGFGNHGLGGGGADYHSGGADSVFTQLLTEKNVKDKMSFHSFNYQSKVRFLISLDALETGTYQYHSDSFGNRNYNTKGFGWGWESYKTRDGILEFIEKEQKAPFVHGGHEVMLKERLAPSYFFGIVVPNNFVKENLINHLREVGVIQNETLLGKPVDAFIRVATNVSEDLLKI